MTEEIHKLGEVLRAAREAKGVELVRVERETKIRERYLAALESGDYRELPGAVYTRGFLRNYGKYLGLDPEYLLDLYRIETASARPERGAIPAPPRPIGTGRPRAFVVTPGAIVAAILVLLVGGFVAWIGFELVNFARTPELRITEPAGNVSGHAEHTITVVGITVPNARVQFDGLPENPAVTAGPDGRFEVTVDLLSGSNVMRVVANDPVTGRDSEPVVRTIVVAGEPISPSPQVGWTLEAPAADATFDGPIEIRGTAPGGSTVSVTATLAEAADLSFSVTTPSGAPVNLQPDAPRVDGIPTIAADANGTFAGTLSLPPGTWDLAVDAGIGTPITRRVTVLPPDGLAARLEIDGGTSYLLLEEDGNLVEDVSGLNAPDGDVVNLEARDSLRIRVGNAGVVRVTINDVSLGLMGAPAQVVEWRVTRSAGE